MSLCRGIGHRFGCACCAPYLWSLNGPQSGVATRRGVLGAALAGSALALGASVTDGPDRKGRAARSAVGALPLGVLLAQAQAGAGADRIYRNARITTMDRDTPAGQAVAVGSGRILAVGNDDTVAGLAGSGTEIIDLDGLTMLPGLVDGHGHVANAGLYHGFVNLQPSPAGPGNSIGAIQESLRTHREHDGLFDDWLLGAGYDESLLAEHRHVTRDDLDAVAQDVPIFVWHVSGHFGAANSLALRLAGIDSATDDPPGGIIRRRAGTREPDGVVEEHGLYLFRDCMPHFDGDRLLDLLDRAQESYARWGITTAQDGASSADEVALLQRAAAADRLDLDIVAYPMVLDPAELYGLTAPEGYSNALRIGGAKLVLDGSPQGKTAWMSEPYLSPPEGWPEDYVGYPLLEDEVVDALVDGLYARGWQVLAHCNGDRSGDQFLDAVEKATAKYGLADRRPVMIHAQTVREDQLDRMQRLGVMPSFFVAHTFYWGDWHRDAVFGPDRAHRISPTQSALDRKMAFTIHNDSPVVPSDSWRLLWSAVNRETRSGQVLGPDQRIDVPTALHAMTLDGAFQHFEEADKGSITPGKRADLVVLSDDPASLPHDRLKDIVVVETIKDGRTIYRH